MPFRFPCRICLSSSGQTDPGLVVRLPAMRPHPRHHQQATDPLRIDGGPGPKAGGMTQSPPANLHYEAAEVITRAG
jgi:hypothetical protein